MRYSSHCQAFAGMLDDSRLAWHLVSGSPAGANTTTDQRGGQVSQLLVAVQIRGELDQILIVARRQSADLCMDGWCSAVLLRRSLGAGLACQFQLY